jgi:predicted alpha/beta superfamily hydrolase
MSTQRPQVTIPDTEIHSLRSSNVEQEFRIFVAHGHAYANSDKAYPVLYVLDANAVFGTVTETARFLAMLKEIPEIIIVGIGYPIDSFTEAAAFRTRDYTITTVDTWYQETFKAVQPDAPEYVGSGGAANFLQFIAKELMPFVNTAYRTIPEDSAICGSSFGGLFALYALFH